MAFALGQTFPAYITVLGMRMTQGAVTVVRMALHMVMLCHKMGVRTGGYIFTDPVVMTAATAILMTMLMIVVVTAAAVVLMAMIMAVVVTAATVVLMAVIMAVVVTVLMVMVFTAVAINVF